MATTHLIRVPPAEELAAGLAPLLSPASRLEMRADMRRWTTMRVGGPADVLVEVGSEPDLRVTLQFCQDRQVPCRVLGRGSNLLVADAGVRGVVLTLVGGEFARVVREEDSIRAGAGAPVREVAAEARRAGLAGLEFLDGIPATVGGALRMNAGAHGSWTFRVVDRVRAMDLAGNAFKVRTSSLSVRYRGCDFFSHHIALEVWFDGDPGEPEAIAALQEQFRAKRRRTQPREPSAGCIFRNPDKVPAGRLIEEAGCKGLSVGGAKVSEVHANFIVNTGGATARDVLTLIEQVRERVAAHANIWLETEIEFWV